MVMASSSFKWDKSSTWEPSGDVLGLEGQGWDFSPLHTPASCSCFRAGASRGSGGSGGSRDRRPPSQPEVEEETWEMTGSWTEEEEGPVKPGSSPSSSY